MLDLNLTELQAQYLELINHTLPAAAVAKQLPVHLNHCFGRILLDIVCGDCWYNRLRRHSKVPAYKQLDLSQLQAAIAVAKNILVQPASYCQELNAQSLAWRKKIKQSRDNF